MWIRLAVEHTEHRTFADVLRVHGIIEEAPFDVGLHHTHTVELRDELKVTSNKGFSKLTAICSTRAYRANQGQVRCWSWKGRMILYFVTARGLREAPHGRCEEEGSGAIYGSQTVLPTNFEDHR